MRGFLGLLAAILVAIGIGVAVEGVQPVSPRTSVANSVPQSTVVVPSSGPCPPTFSVSVEDVRNAAGSLHARELLPRGADTALLCRYEETKPGALVLRRAVVVDSAMTNRLEALIGRLGTARPTGTYGCPAAFPGAIVLAFGYPDGSTVDLWYSNTGCETVDNGVVRGYQVDGGEFPQFEKLVGGLTAVPGTP